MYENEEQRLARIAKAIEDFKHLEPMMKDVKQRVADFERNKPALEDAFEILSYPPGAQEKILRARGDSLDQFKEKVKAQREAEESKAEVERLKAPFVLPEGQEYFSRADIHIWATKNDLGGGQRNINKHIKKDFNLEIPRKDEIEDKISREDFISFLYRLQKKKRGKKT